MKAKKHKIKLCKCGKKSLPGLIKNIALCQYHYNERMWGKAWADKCAESKSKKEGT